MKHYFDFLIERKEKSRTAVKKAKTDSKPPDFAKNNQIESLCRNLFPVEKQADNPIEKDENICSKKSFEKLDKKKNSVEESNVLSTANDAGEKKIRGKKSMSRAEESYCVEKSSIELFGAFVF